MESILAHRDRMTLDNGMQLRLLSAWELLQAMRQARELSGESREQALCSNACLLARALEHEDCTPVFEDGQAVLAGLTVEEIASLAAIWNRFRAEHDPGLDLKEPELDELKKNSAPMPVSGCAGVS